jgi:hypothetical protein
MREINSAEDYKAVVEKYAARLKVARSKYDDFKRELTALEKALAVPASAAASASARKAYEELQQAGKRNLKTMDVVVSEYDDLFDRAARTVKLGR